MDLQPPQGVVAKMKALGKLRELASFSSKIVKDGPCQEVWLDEPDLDLLPILTCWPDDGGPYVTLPLVFSRDPVTGARNCGMYRIQKVDRRTAMMHWQIHKDGAAHLRDSQGAGAGGGGHRLAPGHDLLGHRAAAARHRRDDLRGLPARQERRDGALPHGRPGGAGRGRDRARGLRRRRATCAPRGRSATTPASTPRSTTTRRSTSPACRCAATRSTRPPSSGRRRWRTSSSARPPSGCSCRSSA